MEPEEMDVVELLTDVPVEPDWLLNAELKLTMLPRGERGMVVHREDTVPPVYSVEFLDLSNGDLRALAKLRGDQIRVVERTTLGDA